MRSRACLVLSDISVWALYLGVRELFSNDIAESYSVDLLKAILTALLLETVC